MAIADRTPVVAPPPSWALTLAQERARLLREGRCFVYLRPTSREDRGYVGFLGIVLHLESGGRPQPGYDVLLGLGKDYSRSWRGRWLPRWEILRRLASRWPKP